MIAIMEDNMTATKTTLSLSALVIAGVICAVASLTTQAQASVTSQLLNCKYNTKQKTIACCQQVIRANTPPRWYIEAGRSCNAVAKCVGGGDGPTRNRCYIYIPQDVDRDGGRGQNPPSRQLR
jgi:hypothetical protein